MYQRVLQGTEKAWDPDHITLDTVNNFKCSYKSQSGLDEAEKMYQRALQGYDSYEMAQCGINHTLPLSAAIKTYQKGRAGARDSGGRGWEFDIMAMQGREISIWYGKCYVNVSAAGDSLLHLLII
jgi:hypothetical protein